MLWHLPHICVLSLNGFTGWNHLPDNISLDPRPPKYYKMDLKEILRKAREKAKLAEGRRRRHLKKQTREAEKGVDTWQGRPR